MDNITPGEFALKMAMEKQAAYSQIGNARLSRKLEGFRGLRTLRSHLFFNHLVSQVAVFWLLFKMSPEPIRGVFLLTKWSHGHTILDKFRDTKSYMISNIRLLKFASGLLKGWARVAQLAMRRHQQTLVWKELVGQTEETGKPYK